MAQAIAEGSKTQFRQPISPPVPNEWRVYRKYQLNDRRVYWTNNQYQKDTLRTIYRICTLGKTRDRLWVRELFAVFRASSSVNSPLCPRVIYGGGKRVEGYTSWQLPNRMHRSDSRTTIEITGIRVEKLQDISEADAQAEGVSKDPVRGLYSNSFQHYWDKWDAAHEAYWKSDPWVWVVNFARI